ncbi:MAG: hypothetical protein O3A51_13225, partial [Verrucomicrobia bacterium]|nr:hypothetical protein [Verrucomicrobiota bacterium]
MFTKLSQLGTRFATGLLLTTSLSFGAETYGNFHTMGVILDPPGGYTAAQIGEVRLYEVRPAGDRRLLNPVRANALNYFSGS